MFLVNRSVVNAKGRASSFCTDACYQEHRAALARDRDGAIYLNPHGYVEVLAYDHPAATRRKGTGKWTRRVMEHRLVMERYLGRHLYSWEQVHHKNGQRDDNRIENLELWVRSQPAGHRVLDVYNADVERLLQENARLKHRLAACASCPALQAQKES